MLQIYFIERKKINYNLKIIGLCQPINLKPNQVSIKKKQIQSFKYERGKTKILKLCF